MADDKTYPRSEPFEPLMAAIEKVTAALGDASNDRLREAITQLRATKQIYDPLCRRAHVVKDQGKDKDEDKDKHPGDRGRRK